MQSILNVRMDSALKERGDKVLAENGISVSRAVRALWEELAKSREIPCFIRETSDSEVHRKHRMSAFEKLCTFSDSCESMIDFSSMDDKALQRMQYNEKWKEYEALK